MAAIMRLVAMGRRMNVSEKFIYLETDLITQRSLRRLSLGVVRACRCRHQSNTPAMYVYTTASDTT